MSRFYEALTKASHERGAAKDETRQRPDTTFSAQGIELPPVPPLNLDPEGPEAPPVQDSLDGGPLLGACPKHHSTVASIGEDLLGPVPACGQFGITAQMVLDPRARILPQIVDPAIVEHYAMVRTKLLQLRRAQPFRTLIVASPSPRDGKTVTVLNLAFSFAMLSSLKVLIVDGDLRRGSLGKWMGVDERRGLSNLLEGSAKLEEVVLASDDQPLCVVARGNSKVPPAELLNASNVGSHFRSMAEHFDMILVDSPPVNLVSDTRLLASGCDGVVLVARAFSTTRRALEKAAHELQQFRILGAVLNGGTRPLGSGAKGYYYRTEAATR